MFNWFFNLNHILQALIATLFTYFITCLGASLVLFFKKINKNVMDIMLGFSAGVMLAASFYSLLSPSIEMASNLFNNKWLIPSIGFLFGGIFLLLGDKVFDKVQGKNNNNKLKRVLLLLFSITLHNIPEGLAVGVAYGSLKYGLDGVSIISASMIALGIGLQNFPEGTIVSVPLRREGFSRKKAFLFGQLSAIVEPISGVIGAILVLKVRLLLPFLLSFAAGAMIYVVIKELIPESQNSNNKEIITFFTIIGFLIMMILDVALG